MRAYPLVVFVVAVVMGAAPTALAVPCPVPSGSHPTVQAAVDDAACTEIELGAQVYTESVDIGRTLTLSGVSSSASSIAGQVHVTGASTVATLADLTVDGSDPTVAGCFSEAVDVAGGGRLIGTNLVVVNADGSSACPIFGDGFEDGTAGAWSAVTP